ncbi:MAG: flagellin [Candidatus Sericytochromatia bacterium]|nr:flagellin [Candidatus Tanganyikabacteria bacterium]
MSLQAIGQSSRFALAGRERAECGIERSLGRLASGLRIQGAADDAAGLQIAERFRAQVRGLAQAATNAQDAINLVRTMEGALAETTALVQRMRELVVHAANDTLTSEDRIVVKDELDQLSSEVDGIADRTEYNTRQLLLGFAMDAPLTFQIGASADQVLALTVSDMRAYALYVASSDLTVSSHEWARETLWSLDNSLLLVNGERARLGAAVNRLEHTIANLSVQRESMAASESRIRDLDMAAEVAQLTRFQIVAQSSQAMLVQAQQIARGVVGLLV